MKKFLLVCSLLGALGASAQTFTVDGINYKVLDTDARTVSVEKNTPSYTGEIVIPATVTNDNVDYTVTAITQSATASTSDGAFANCSGVTSITLPSTITALGNYSFNNCSGLTSLTIPESVTTFGDGVFQNCTGLTSLTLPATAETMGKYMFKTCSKLPSLTIPEGITVINDDAIQGMGELVNCTLPSTLQTMGNNNFKSCAKIPSIVIPEGVTAIGTYFASQCSALETVELPSTLASIGNYSFWNSKAVKSISCAAATPPTVASGVFFGWGDTEFAACTLTVPKEAVEAYKAADVWKKFTNIEAQLAPAAEIGTMFTVGGITYIVRENTDRLAVAVTTYEDPDGEGASYSGAVTVPSTVAYEDRDYTVTEIGVGAFYSCKDLTGITLPETLETIGEYAFSRCTGLENMNALPAALTSIGSHAFAYTALKAIAVAEGSKNFAAEADVLYSLDANGQPATVIVCAPGTVGAKTVSESVTAIEYAAFAACEQVSGITLPSTLTTIGQYAFDGCLRLYELTIPESVTEIGAQAFYKCEYLSDITLPSKLQSLEEGLFMFCRSLASVEIPATVKSVGPYVFEACTALTQISIPEGCTFLGDHAFEGCTALTAISLPQSLKSIDQFAFIGCTGLKEITFPKEMDLLGYGAFKDCIQIETINMPQSLGELGGYAFCHCDKLTSIVLPDGLTEIPERLFWECNKLTDITIPTSVKTIGEYAFSNAGITEMSLHEGVTTIGGYAFQKCAKLKEISLPSTVTSMGDYVFWNCNSLMKMTSLATVPPTAVKSFNSFNNVTKCKLYVPEESLDTYREAEGWSKFTNISGIPGVGYIFTADGITYCITALTDDGCNVEVIRGESAYTGNVVIPESVSDYYECAVTAIANDAFADCTGLTGVTIPASVKTIGSNAFKGCTGLSAITCLGSTPATVESDAFEGLDLAGITLSVPDDASEAYKAAEVWKDFFTAGISEIMAEIKAGEPVYDLQGRRVANPAQPGIYVVKGRKIYLK